MVIKNMIIFEFGEINGVEFQKENLIEKHRFKNIPIIQNGKPVGMVMHGKIQGSKIIGKVAWWTERMIGKPKKKFDSVDINFEYDKYELQSIVVATGSDL